MADAHDTGLYYLGKGILYFDRFDGAGLPTGQFDLGNCSAFTLQPVVEKLDHYSSREGVRKKDKTVVLSAGLSVKFTLDEYDRDNLAMALFGTRVGQVINLLDSTTLEGELTFVGANDVGPNFRVELWNVSLQPSSEVPFITDAWGEIAFEGEVQSDIANHPTQEYGIITEINLS